jgi:hypothetical protein
MAVKPQNVVASLKDRRHAVSIDLSADLSGPLLIPDSLDPSHDQEVISANLYVTTAHIASQALTVEVGESVGPSGAADVDKFVDAVSTGTALVAAGGIIPLTLTNTTLQAGHQLTYDDAHNASQTGVATLVVVLRPKEKDRGNLTKRPGGSAQSQT